jgi:hypothetical protein
MMEAAREQAGGELTPLEERLERDEAEIRSTHIKQEVEARSAAASWPTAASTPWPARCASRCPRTSTSCTPAARR